MKEKDNLPFALLDEDGYPTDEWIQYINNYIPSEVTPLPLFVNALISDGWHMSEWGAKLHRKYRGKRKLELHTGGWSGNEKIIAAITSNIFLTKAQLKYVMWQTGGHYYFELGD